MKLHPLDLSIIAIYMFGVTLVGWYFSRKQRNIRDYFLSDKNVPWWALAGSIVATETSTVTFISVPAFAFAANSRGEGGNLTFLQLVIGYMIGRLLIVWLFIPLYFRGELFTVYQILDQRFGGKVKRVAATLFLVTRTIADGVRLFATGLVLVALAGWSDQSAILLIGIVTIAYTYLGGMAAVIWTDLIQLVIYLVGACVAALILLHGIPGGWNAVVELGHQHQKFQLFDFTVSLARNYTFWAGIIGGAFLTTATHGTDQLMVQRYLCSRTPRDASAALLSSGVLILAQFVLFLLIGIMLFVFYQKTGTLPESVARRPDQIFPHFIVTQLPHGIVLFLTEFTGCHRDDRLLSAVVCAASFGRALFEGLTLADRGVGCGANYRRDHRDSNAATRGRCGAGGRFLYQRPDPRFVFADDADPSCRESRGPGGGLRRYRLHELYLALVRGFVAMVCPVRLDGHFPDRQPGPSTVRRKAMTIPFGSFYKTESILDWQIAAILFILF
jgi:SSS family transporter